MGKDNSKFSGYKCKSHKYWKWKASNTGSTKVTSFEHGWVSNNGNVKTTHPGSCWALNTGSVKSQILQMISEGNYILGHGYCKRNGSRILQMATGENYILGLVYCKGLKDIAGHGFCKGLM